MAKSLIVISNINDSVMCHDVYVDSTINESDDVSLLFNTCSQRIIKELFGDNASNYTFVNSNLRVDAYATENNGWLRAPTQKLIGGIWMQSVSTHRDQELREQITSLREQVTRITTSTDKQKATYESRIIALDEQLNESDVTIKRLQAELETLRNDFALRTNEYKRLINENLTLRAASSMDTDTIIRLNDEVGKLRAISKPSTRFNYNVGIHCVEECKINDNNINTNTNSTNTSTSTNTTTANTNTTTTMSILPPRPAIPDASYDACIDQIRGFKLSSLRTRAQRDAGKK